MLQFLAFHVGRNRFESSCSMYDIAVGAIGPSHLKYCITISTICTLSTTITSDCCFINAVSTNNLLILEKKTPQKNDWSWMNQWTTVYVSKPRKLHHRSVKPHWNRTKQTKKKRREAKTDQTLGKWHVIAPSCSSTFLTYQTSKERCNHPLCHVMAPWTSLSPFHNLFFPLSTFAQRG